MKHRTPWILAWMALALGLAGAPLAADGWRPTEPGGPTPPARSGHSMVRIGDQVYIFGGRGLDGFFDDVWEYSWSTSTFRQVIAVNEAPAARAGHVATAFDGKMYVTSGENEQGSFSDLWELDPATGIWTQRPSSRPSGLLTDKMPGRVNATATIVNGNILVFGGRSKDGSQTHGDLWNYNIQSQALEQRAPVFQGYERSGHSAMPVDEMMYVFAGRNHDFLNNMLVYDATSNSWSIFVPQGAVPPERAQQTTASEGYVMIVTGGTGSGPSGLVSDPVKTRLTDTWQFDAATNRWTELADGPPAENGAGAFTEPCSTGWPACPESAGQAADRDPRKAGSSISRVIFFGGLRDGQPVDETWLYLPDNPAGGPVAEFSWSPHGPADDQPVAFDDLSSGEAATWTWDFGDGSTSLERRPTHAYLSPGSYTVTLTAANAFGSDSVSHEITVEPAAGGCQPGAETACLLGGQFEVAGTMTDFASPPRTYDVRVMDFPGGRAESDQAVFFQSFSPGNFEIGVKMVDGCGFPEGHPLRNYWVFFGGLTNAETEVTVEDSVTGQTLTWSNPAGIFPLTLGDTSAFPCVEGLPDPDVDGAPILVCVRDAATACLLGGRFWVTGTMNDFNTPPQEYEATVMSFAGGRAESDQAVFFESFSPGNFEVGVKMVDGCGFPEGHPLRFFWAFYGGLTNAGTRIEVTQLATGRVDVWENPAGAFPISEGRTSAFPCD